MQRSDRYQNRNNTSQRLDPIENVHGTLQARSAYSNLLYLDDQTSRSRTDLGWGATTSMNKILALPENLFFEQTRMKKGKIFDLADCVVPYFERPRSRKGPKPVPYICIFLFTVRELAHNISSWSLMSADWDVGKSTLAPRWTPEMCEVITMAIPLPNVLQRDSTEEWAARNFSFETLAQLCVQKDMRLQQS